MDAAEKIEDPGRVSPSPNPPDSSAGADMEFGPRREELVRPRRVLMIDSRDAIFSCESETTRSSPSPADMLPAVRVGTLVEP